MKLIFICGCMEPGKDGVGDYTRRLSGELIREGHLVSIIALNDKRVKDIKVGFQLENQTPIDVMRLPAKLDAKIRFREAEEYITGKDPEWISLQFVPYSFHMKGLPFSMPNYLYRFSKKYNWHLMIHEPWVDTIGPLFSLKKLTGILQRRILKNIVKKINPTVIQTSNLFYMEILKANGISSSILNLPGNIPICRGKNLNIGRELRDLGIENTKRGDWWITGTFGRMRKNIDYVSFFNDLLERSGMHGKKLAFFSIGEAGINGQEIFDHLEKTFNGKLLLYQFGSRKPEEISAFFQILDFGVASVPIHLLGKSGAYSSMREHNVKVLIPMEKNYKKKKTKSYSYNQILSMKDQQFSAKKIAKNFISVL